MCESKRFPEEPRLYRCVVSPLKFLAEGVITTLLFGGAILAGAGILMFLLSLIVQAI